MACCRRRKRATMPQPWSCWTTPTRSRRRPSVLAGAALALAVSTCSPNSPPGVSRDALDAQVSRAIGDPNSCLLIADATSGKVLYRYNTHTACERELPACEGVGTTKVRKLLDRTVKDRQVRQLSCNTLADASRGVG